MNSKSKATFVTRRLVGAAAAITLVLPSIAGCDAIKKLLPGTSKVSSVTTTPTAAPDEYGAQEAHFTINLLTVHVRGPVKLGNGTRIVGTTQDGILSPDAGATGAKAFGILQNATAVDLPVQNALVGIRGYDAKTIPQLTDRYTDEEGVTYFRYVPSRVAFFLEASTIVNGKAIELLGLTRTPDEGVNSEVTVDIASTLVARELLRAWQITGYQVSYKDLSQKDFYPLLATLRSVFRNGFPSDIPLDLSTVSIPDGDWSLEADRQDGAVVFLDKLAQRNDAVRYEVGRLYKAVNFALCNCVNDTKIGVRRPSFF